MTGRLSEVQRAEMLLKIVAELRKQPNFYTHQALDRVRKVPQNNSSAQPSVRRGRKGQHADVMTKAYGL